MRLLVTFLMVSMLGSAPMLVNTAKACDGKHCNTKKCKMKKKTAAADGQQAPAQPPADKN